MSSGTSSAGGKPRRQLTIFDSACIIVGIIIGAGIYKTTPLVASNVSSAGILLLVWILGGLISIVGALCYAELATAYPREGGDYIFLNRAYGPRAGFLFVWAEFWIIRPGNVGMMAFVFARYANRLFPLGLTENEGLHEMAYASAAVLVLSAINVLGVRTGKWTQNVLTSVKVAGLLSIFVAGMLFAPAAATGSVSSDSASTNWGIAMVLVLFTYGGWNEMSYVAAEVRDPNRNIFRALIAGTLTVTLVYVLVNVAMLHMLGLSGLAGSNAIAADVMRPHFGETAARAMSCLVCVSCLGSINGMLFTGSRIYYALGTEQRLFGWLGQWSIRWDSPARAIVLQMLVTLALVVGFGMNTTGFERLLYFMTPVFWFFIFMVSISLFILRYKEPKQPRPHKVLWYPWLPIVFCISTAYLCVSSLEYAVSQDVATAAWAVLIVAAGVAVSRLDTSSDEPFD